MFNTQDAKQQFFTPTLTKQAIIVLATSPNPIYEIFIPATEPNGTPVLKQDGSQAVRPYRSSVPIDGTVKPAREGDLPAKVFYCLLYNETLNLLQVWGIKQKTVLNQLAETYKAVTADNKKINNVTFLVSRKGTTQMDTEYFVLPHTDRAGKLEYNEVPSNVLTFFRTAQANGDIEMGNLMKNDYPLKGIATMQVPKLTEGLPLSSVKDLIDIKEYGVAMILANSIFHKIEQSGGEIVEDGTSFTKEDIINILNNKAICLD